MKKNNLKYKLIVSLMSVFLISTFIPNISFAYIQNATWGITDPFPSSQTYYNSNGSLKAMYTYYSEVNFKFLNNPSSLIIPENSALYFRKETELGSGQYGSWQKADLTFWGTASGSSVGGVQFSGTFCKFILPEEGRYEVVIYAHSSTNYTLFTQKFHITYSPSVLYDSLKVVHAVNVDTTNFVRYNGGTVKVTATVHDISGYGIRKENVKIGMAYLPWMIASRGYASLNWASDIAITRSSINYNEYTITGTVTSEFFQNRVGEYYINLELDTNGKWKHWNFMMPRFYIR